MDVFGNGRTALKASFARYVAGQADRGRQPGQPDRRADRTDTRPWTDLDGNGLPLDADGNIQFNELAHSASTPTFGRNCRPRSTIPTCCDGWGKRGYNNECTVAAQHQLADRVSVNGGYYRRTFGNQTFTDDLRYDANSYDSFCITAPADPRPAGRRRLPGVRRAGPEARGVRAEPAGQQPDPLFRGLRRRDEPYQGSTSTSRRGFRNGAFLKGGIGATSRTFDNCNLLAAGLRRGQTRRGSFMGTEIYPDGTHGCHREYRLSARRQDVGSYTLPWDIQLAGTYQFTPRRADRRRRPEHPAIWS